MVIPSQDLISCKGCGELKPPHSKRKFYCVECTKKLHVAYTAKHREKLKSVPRIAICKTCGKDFDVSLTGRTWKCPDCLLKYQQEYAKKDKERHAEYSRKYRARKGDEYRLRMQRRRGELLAAMTQEEQSEFRKKECEKSARLFAKLRNEVFAAYGGHVCACCGEHNPMFLTIDHINNDGAEMRNNGMYGRSGTAFYQWLRKSGFPAGFQVLCYNCNLGKHRNGGICPHQSGKV